MGRWRAWMQRMRQVAPEQWVLLALVVGCMAIWFWAVRALPRPLEVVAFAVGDGDAYLIRSPSGHTILWDGGSRSVEQVGERVLVPNLLLLGVHKLDAIIISHPDSDHVNGLPAVIEAMKVGMILDPEQPNESTPYQQVVELAKAKTIPRFRLKAGGCLNLGPRVTLRFLAPGPHWLTGTPSDSNNNCAVAMLEYGHTRMLFTADLELEGEQALLTRETDLRADVCTVAHHGSRSGTSEGLLAAVRPYLALISSKGGPAGTHPHPDVIARLRARGVKILRTDVHGQVRLISNGKIWSSRTFRQVAGGR